MKTETITYTSAIDTFFGGILALARQPLPFKCKCGDNTYPIKSKHLEIPIMSVADCFKHIRKVHKEKIKREV